MYMEEESLKASKYFGKWELKHSFFVISGLRHVFLLDYWEETLHS